MVDRNGGVAWIGILLTACEEPGTGAIILVASAVDAGELLA